MARVIVDLGNGDTVTVRDEQGMVHFVILGLRTGKGERAEVVLRRDQAEQVISALVTETKRLERER